MPVSHRRARERQGKMKGGKSFFYLPVSLAPSFAGAQMFVYTSPSTLTVELNRVLTTHAV